MATTENISKEQILDAIAQLSVMDIVDLIASMEDKFNVSAAAVAAPAMAAGTGGASPEDEAKTEVNLELSSFGENKIGVIKVIRAITGLGLKEAKEMVEGAPCLVKEGVTPEEAEELKKQIEESGATVALK